MITDLDYVSQRPHLGGVQRFYRSGRYGLSLVNSPMLHYYPFAWEAAVLDYGSADGDTSDLTYSTPLTNNVEVFYSDEEANDFVAKFHDWTTTVT